MGNFATHLGIFATDGNFATLVGIYATWSGNFATKTVILLPWHLPTLAALIPLGKATWFPMFVSAIVGSQTFHQAPRKQVQQCRGSRSTYNTILQHLQDSDHNYDDNKKYLNRLKRQFCRYWHRR